MVLTEQMLMKCIGLDCWPVLILALPSKLELCVFFTWPAGEGSVSPENSKMSLHDVNAIFVVGEGIRTIWECLWNACRVTS